MFRISNCVRAVPNPDEMFSELCSDMLEIVCKMSDPGIDSCFARRCRLKIVGRLARSGWTVRRFLAELRRRTSGRWVCFGPFGLLEQFEAELERAATI